MHHENEEVMLRADLHQPDAPQRSSREIERLPGVLDRHAEGLRVSTLLGAGRQVEQLQRGRRFGQNHLSRLALIGGKYSTQRIVTVSQRRSEEHTSELQS